jgi:hypothetical protein
MRRSPQLRVTRSCFDVLHSIWVDKRPTYGAGDMLGRSLPFCRVWIDQVSVEQTNMAEIGDQVRLMREIYSRACAVLI